MAHKKKMKPVRIEAELYDCIDTLSQEERRSITQMANMLIEEALERRNAS
jgi:hypothetical protein